MIIRLPWPPTGTSPNGSQGNFRGKATAARGYKWAAHIARKDQKVPRLKWVECVTITFHPPRNGKYDLDNMLARCKQGLDAVAQAIGVDDAKWQEVRLRRGGVAAYGAVVIEINEMSDRSILLPIVGMIS